jgi:predicted ester cyclase
MAASLATADSGNKTLVLATGTHRGVFLNVPPTGRRVAIAGIDMFRVRDGALVEAWVSSDVFGLVQQIGGMPAGGGAGA